jgi:hypothetical protein
MAKPVPLMFRNFGNFPVRFFMQRESPITWEHLCSYWLYKYQGKRFLQLEYQPQKWSKDGQDSSGRWLSGVSECTELLGNVNNLPSNMWVGFPAQGMMQSTGRN